MHKVRLGSVFGVAFLCLGGMVRLTPGWAQEESVKPGINDPYRNPDVEEFIGRFETESRAIYKHRFEILESLQLKKGMRVADIGAGTGFFARMIAREVGPEGRVYAVDIAPNFLDHIEKTCKEESLENVETILCDQKSTRLPEESVDLAFLCDTYHHFEFPHETLQSIHRALRPGGRLVIVDFERIRGISSDWVLGHVRCGKGTVTDEVKDAGFDLVKEVSLMKEQYVLQFRKRDPAR